MTDEIKTLPLGQTFQDVFDGIAYEALEILYERQRKYGPKNIEQLGLFGVFDRLASDKVERVRKAFNGRLVAGKIELDDFSDFGDESFEDALFDISNYALIMIALRRGLWGKPLREHTDEVQRLAGDGPIQQLTDGTEEGRFTGFPDGVEEPASQAEFEQWLMADGKEQPHPFRGYSPASRFCNLDGCGREPEHDIHLRPEEMGEPI